ncbi:MAG: membrane dipeptidase [Oscillospiraceae bacterium]|nr:membrane dipeptidase [Oscillospiraceae bacterium]
MKFPVFDLHCDTARALLGASFRECGSLRENELHIDLNRAKDLPGYAQCFACYVDTDYKAVKAVEQFEREMVSVLREVEKHSDLIRLVYTAEEIEENHKAGIMSALLTIEGAAGFAYDPELLEDLYTVGFRMTSLGWNESNPLTGSHCTGGGLTDAGRAFLKEAQRLGYVLDVSHISDEGFWDVIEAADAPVIASHSNSRVICNHSRNLTDDMFKAIAASGGTVGINLYSAFIGNAADLDAVCDHILHFVELDPDATHISLGGDLDGCDSLATGFEGVQSYGALAQRLAERGLDDKMLHNIFWNNAIEVIRKCCT